MVKAVTRMCGKALSPHRLIEATGSPHHVPNGAFSAWLRGAASVLPFSSLQDQWDHRPSCHHTARVEAQVRRWLHTPCMRHVVASSPLVTQLLAMAAITATRTRFC